MRPASRRDAAALGRDRAITPPPGVQHSEAGDAAAYSETMIDRAIGADSSNVSRVLRDQQLRRVLLIAVVTQLLDAFTTAAGLHVGLSERNPFTVSILRAYGSAGLLLQKVMVDCLLLAAMAKLPRRTALLAVGLVTLVTAVVVGANLLGLLAAVD